MALDAVLDNLLSAPILFFLLGVGATLVKSDLEIPKPAARFLSQYLLIAIGLKGGIELAKAGFEPRVILVLAVAMAASAVVPLWTFFLLRRKVGVENAAAIAATYGSISAVTYITAEAFLRQRGIESSGYMVAAMALMESPALIVGVLLARIFVERNGDDANDDSYHGGWSHLIRESLVNGAVLLLLGSLLVGVIIGPGGGETLDYAFKYPFIGILSIFLLDMGLVAARQLSDLKSGGWMLPTFAIVAAPVHAALGIGVAAGLGLGRGDALLLAVLMGSASYIAVPAAVRLTLPRANPSLFVPMSLGLTFPFNVIVGIPAYSAVIDWIWL